MEGSNESVTLLRWFLGPTSDAAANTDPFIVRTSRLVDALLRRDCTVKAFPNESLCPSYPPTLYVFGDSHSASAVDPTDFASASHARARTRFVIPVLQLENGAVLCRSSTLSVAGETAYNAVSSAVADLFSGSPRRSRSQPQQQPAKESSMVGRNRAADVALLRKLGVSTIFDLMKEQRKIKFGVTVASSEKADSYHRYEGFELCGIPYPGTEGFVAFSDAEDASVVPLSLRDGEDALPFFHEAVCLPLNWTQWTRWSLGELTLNYLRAILHAMARPNGGCLVHCLSGWDRTPLFVSLVRCVAWAERAAHASLTVDEFLYLSLAWDWLLFRHRLADRMSRREEVMFFAYYAVTLVALDDSVRISSACAPDERRERLLLLNAAFGAAWAAARKDGV